MSFTNPDGTEVVVTRTLRAPVERVYRAFTDPTDMAAWMWGPLAANPKADVDLRVGDAQLVEGESDAAANVDDSGISREVLLEAEAESARRFGVMLPPGLIADVRAMIDESQEPREQEEDR